MKISAAVNASLIGIPVKSPPNRRYSASQYETAAIDTSCRKANRRRWDVINFIFDLLPEFSRAG